MGMFDDVRCEVPLPDGYDGGNFRTKDFDCELATFTITADGELWREPGWYTPDLPRVRVNYHGIVNFYGYDRRGLAPMAPHDETRWHEYEAKFTDGKLVSIEVFERKPLIAPPAVSVEPGEQHEPRQDLGDDR